MLASAITFTITKPMRHPYLRGLVSVGLSVLIALPALVDTRLALLVPGVGAAVAVAYESKWASIPVALSFIFSLLLALQPHGAELLYLENKYSDSITYVSEGVYHSGAMDKDFHYNRTYGDDYQHILYYDEMVNAVKHSFPEDTEFGRITITPVTTNALYWGWDKYYDVVKPTVTVQARIPEKYTQWSPDHLAQNISWEELP